MNWQPIESAPRDGTAVLVTDGYEVVIARWRGRRCLYRCADRRLRNAAAIAVSLASAAPSGGARACVVRVCAYV